ncbi:MAG: ureidoglycolate lyase [Dongiaceae bacterium]
MTRHVIVPQPLTRAAFRPFGDVIETEGAAHHTINDGHAERYHDLANIDCAAEGGRPLVNIFRATPWPAPVRITQMERHPLSSQAFIPLSATPFVVIVAPPGPEPVAGDLQAFITNGKQGVNFQRGTWHHPLLARAPASDFIVIDRDGPGENCDWVHYENDEILLGEPAG